MATDATGTPTALGIPKYNPSADAPSGLGFNAAMDAIDTLIANRVLKPASIASGEVAVWNGTTFVRSTVTNIGPSSLGSGTPDNTKFLRGDGTWQVVSIPTVGYGTSLPGSPTDGQEYILVDSTTAPTYQWRFRYNAGSSQADKWEFVGGPGALAQTSTDDTVNSTTYIDGSQVVSFTIPRAGVYRLRFGATAMDLNAADNYRFWMAPKIGAAATADADAVHAEHQGSGDLSLSLARTLNKTCAASDVVKLQFRGETATSKSVADKFLEVVPVRVS